MFESQDKTRQFLARKIINVNMWYVLALLVVQAVVNFSIMVVLDKDDWVIGLASTNGVSAMIGFITKSLLEERTQVKDYYFFGTNEKKLKEDEDEIQVT